MYYFEVLYSPALGKGNELRTVLEERTRQHQAAGIDCELDQPCIAPEPGFGLILRFDDLRAFESFRDRAQKDNATQQFFARVTPLVSRQASTILWEDIVENTVDKPWEYLQVVTFTPGVGHQNSLAWELRERIEMRQQKGRPCGLYGSMYSGVGQLAIVLGASEISEIQEWAVENRNDPGFLAFQDRLTPLMIAPPQVQLLRTLVRFKKIAFPQMATAAAR